MSTDSPALFSETYAPLVDNGYDVLPIAYKSKVPPKGEPWQNRPPRTKDDCADSSKRHPGSGAGVRTGEVVALDIDVYDPAVSRSVMEYAEMLVGSAPTRIGRHPKALMMYRTSSPFSKISSSTYRDSAGNKSKVEVLAKGQYFVAYGIHPDTGKAYEWVTHENPINTHVAQLGDFQPEHATAIFAEFERQAINAGWQRVGGPSLPVPTHAEGDDWAADVKLPDPETPDNIKRVKSALVPISADCSRDVYRNIGFAILSTGWECGEKIFLEWSMTAPHRFDEAAFRNIVDSAKSDRPNGIGLGSLFKTAKENGWIDPRKTLRLFETYGDTSNGRRLADRYRGWLLYIVAINAWYVWTGQRWAPCENGEEMAAAKAIAEECLRETISALVKNGTEAAKRNHTQALGVHRSARRLEAMLQMATSEPGMSIANPGLFDANPMLLGVKKAALNLRNGELLEARPDMLVSRQAGTEYDRLAQCPMWTQFVHEVMHGDGKMVAFLQRICGYALTGLVTEEMLFFFLGMGANGKSVYMNVVAAAMGDYAVTVRSALLARDPKGSGSDAEREKCRLPGARIALMNETGQGDVWDDQRTKELVSRERVSARQLYGESFDFMPTHKLFIRGNHQPGAMDNTDGFWRRIVLIGFTRQFPESERIPDLDRQIIEKELPGVLAWMVEGCLEWQKHGLQVPASITAAVDTYRRDTDLMGEWIEACCTVSPGAEDSINALFTSYEMFLKEANTKAPSRNTFGRQLVQRGFPKRKSNGQSLYTGISLHNPFEVEEL